MSEQGQSASQPWYYGLVLTWQNWIGNGKEGQNDVGTYDPNQNGYITPTEAKEIETLRPPKSDLDRAAFDHDITRINAKHDKDLAGTVKSDLNLSADSSSIFAGEVLLFHASPSTRPQSVWDGVQAGAVAGFGIVAAGAAVIGSAVNTVSSWVGDAFRNLTAGGKVEEGDIGSKKKEVEATESPVVLDIDNDGLELVSVADSKAYFDLDGDGVAEKLGWISGGDAILVFDANDSGSVDNRIEFAFVAWKEGAKTDLEGLSHFDTDGDGHLSEADAGSRFNWDQFMIWKDANGNGVSEQGELVTLKEAGIVSIGLDLKGNASEMNGNIVHQTTTFRYADGSEGTVGDVSFAVLRASLGNERSSREIEVAKDLAMQDAEREGATLESVSVSPAAYDLVLL